MPEEKKVEKCKFSENINGFFAGNKYNLEINLNKRDDTQKNPEVWAAGYKKISSKEGIFTYALTVYRTKAENPPKNG